MKFYILSCLLFTQVLMAQTSSKTDAEYNISSNTAAASKVDIEDFSKKDTGNFGISMYFLGGFDNRQFEYSKPSFGIFDSYISFDYRVTQDVRVSARPAFAYTTAGHNSYGTEVDDKGSVRDFSFAASFANLFEQNLPSNMDLKFKPRLYLPTGDRSKDEGMIARLRLELESRYYLGRYTHFRFYVKPSYFFQRNTTYWSTSNPNYSSLLTTRMMDSEHGFNFSYNMNKYYSFVTNNYFDETWSNTSDLNGPRTANQYRTSELKYNVGVELRPMRGLNMTVSVGRVKDLINTSKEESLQYTLLTNAFIY